MRLTQLLMSLTGKYAEKFAKYGGYTPTPLSLKKLTSFGLVGSPEKSATFLCDELPVRLANITQEIQLLPESLIQTPSASIVKCWYEKSFCELVDFDGVKWDQEHLDEFNKKLAVIRNRHTTVVETMAQGVMEMKERHKTDTITNNQLQYFLDRFYMMRISLRMLINQHPTYTSIRSVDCGNPESVGYMVHRFSRKSHPNDKPGEFTAFLMFGPELNKQRRFVGSIDPNCNVLEILEDAYEDAKYLCQHYYSNAPEMEVDTCGAIDGKVEFVYVPSHLYHILFELIKNAMRAVMEVHSHANSYPPIKVLVAGGDECVTIKISDLGGGIARSQLDLVFNYTYTTAPDRTNSQEDAPMPSDQASNAPMAGYGYGLPLSRLYAKYFNGDLVLASVEGYGTDALLYMKRNAADADEMLPVFNRTSARQYGSAGNPVADWSNPRFKTGWRRN